MYQFGLVVGFKKAHKRDEPSIVKIDIERHSGQLCAYEHGTNRYIAQGPDYEALQKALKVVEPNVTFIASNEQVAEFGGKNGDTV
jgi:hypothetical protein